MKALFLGILYLGDLLFILLWKALFYISEGPRWIHNKILDQIRKADNKRIL